MKIFSGNSNKSLAKDVCKYLGIDLGKLKIKKFSDGELSCLLYTSPSPRD